MSEKSSAIRLNRLTIKNYKKIDYLEIDFPRPLMKDDADILVFGSKNGGGKTSVLECCALIMLIGMYPPQRYISLKQIKIANLIRAGQKRTIIRGEIENGKRQCTIEIAFDIDANKCVLSAHITGDNFLFKNHDKSRLEKNLKSIFSFSTEPVIETHFLHFNSYRRVQESNPTAGTLLENTSRSSNLVSLFKIDIFNIVMGFSGKIKGINQKESQIILNQLNDIVERYCGGEILELNPQPNSTFEILITPKDGGESFSFDGLSSGQKEIIATLFLIWKNTQNQPSTVLIDEPELHLNAEWHRRFVNQLYQLAPQNQYILATHSERIFGSVDKNHRGILELNQKEV